MGKTSNQLFSWLFISTHSFQTSLVSMLAYFMRLYQHYLSLNDDLPYSERLVSSFCKTVNDVRIFCLSIYLYRRFILNTKPCDDYPQIIYCMPCCVFDCICSALTMKYLNLYRIVSIDIFVTSFFPYRQGS